MSCREAGVPILRRAEPAPALPSICFWCERAHEARHPLSVCGDCLAALRARRFPMGRLEMEGPYPLTDDAVDRIVSRTSPGNYALGYMDGATFTVYYVGRSDLDVRSCLHGWVGTPSRSERYEPSTRAAWGLRPRGHFPFGAPSLSRVGYAFDGGYTRFAYSYARSPEAAFDKECRNYHDFGGRAGLDNALPPVGAPEGPDVCAAGAHVPREGLARRTPSRAQGSAGHAV